MRFFFGAMVSCVIVILLLASCAAGPTVDDDLYAYLSTKEHHKVAEIDFGHVVPGDWTKMVIVCAGATKDELDKALGFEWKDAPSLQASSNFISMAVFARKNDVESFDNVGSDPFIEGEWYFTPCTSEILGDPDTAEPLSLPRAHSKIFLTFHNSDTPHFWYVSKQEFQRLRSESNNFRESDVSQ
jgi:hypothetical protein